MNSVRKIWWNILMPASLGTLALWFALQHAGIESALAFTDSLVSVGTIAVFSLLLSTTIRHYRPPSGKEWNLAAWILVLDVLWFVSASGLLHLFYGENTYFKTCSIPLPG